MRNNSTIIPKFKKVFIIFLVSLICFTSCSLATEILPEEGKEVDEVQTSLPQIEMKVKFQKVGETVQVLVECWGSNYTDLEGMDFVFTYDNTKLIPSNISDNAALNDLDKITYEIGETATDKEAFKTLSNSILSKSFAFDDAYSNLLGIDIFKYLAPSGNNEALQFVLTSKTSTSINASEPVLLGRFSFKQLENTIIDGNEFSTKKIQLICNDLEEFYSRIEQDGEDCTEIMDFVYEKYGSVSGTIDASFFTSNVNMRSSKNIATVKLYKAEDVINVNWDATKGYDIIRNELPLPVFSYTTSESDNGQFYLDKIPLGSYVMMIDKNMYADYIITDIVIDSTNIDVKLDELIGDIKLTLGDIDKDGSVKGTDRLAVNNAYRIFDTTFDIDDSAKMDGVDKVGFNMAYKLYVNKVIKTVISLDDLEGLE